MTPDEETTPHCRFEYIEAIGSCYAFDWNESWEETERWLDQLCRDESGIAYGDWEEKADASDDVEERLAVATRALKAFDKARNKADKSSGRKHTIIKGVLYSVPHDMPFAKAGVDDFEEVSDPFKVDDFFTSGEGREMDYADAVQHLLRLKAQAQRWRPQPQGRYSAVTGVEEDAHMIGPYGQNLGVSPSLWRSWMKFASAASGVYSFSLSFPSDLEGCSTWVIPVYESEGSYFGVLPRRDIPPCEWKLAVMCPLADWANGSSTPGWTSNWLTKTTSVGARDAVVMKWLLTFIIQSATITAEQYAT
jgi:hypothetical protein